MNGYKCPHKYCMWNIDSKCKIEKGPDGPKIMSYHTLPGYCRFVYKKRKSLSQTPL